MISKLLLLAFALMLPALLASADDKPGKADTSKPTPVEKYRTMPSGVEFFDIAEGSGREVKLGDTVTVHYTGWLTSGKKFDSSVDRGRPFTFTVGSGVIKGWSEGVQGMKVGGKRQLRIPPDLAYGMRGAPPVIPPNSTLIFDIEALNVR